MPGIVVQPTPTVVRAAGLLEEAVGRVLEAYGTVELSRKYEANFEAKTLLWLIIRNTEGVYELARKDLVLLPAAISAARSAFEIAVRVLWLLDPKDPFEREVRWLAQLQTEEGYHERVGKRLEELGKSGAASRGAAKQIREFRLGVSALLPAGRTPLRQIPNFDEMLRSLGQPEFYLHYIHLSQFAHGTHVAGGLYRRNLGLAKQSGEFVRPADWFHPLGACGFALMHAGSKVVRTLSGNDSPFLTDAFRHKLQAAIDRVRSDGGEEERKSHRRGREKR